MISWKSFRIIQQIKHKDSKIKSETHTCILQWVDMHAHPSSCSVWFLSCYYNKICPLPILSDVTHLDFLTSELCIPFFPTLFMSLHYDSQLFWIFPKSTKNHRTSVKLTHFEPLTPTKKKNFTYTLTRTVNCNLENSEPPWQIKIKKKIDSKYKYQ